MTETNYFVELNNVNVSDKIEKKNGLSYLSWAYAWGEVKKRYPEATYTVYENQQGWNYFTDGKTAWVKTGVCVNGIEHIEYLPVMDYKNKSIPVDNITSFDVNKTIQRSLTKAVARHGLGLYVYAGEDLPETEQAQEPTPQEKAKETREANKAKAIELNETARKTIEWLKTLKRELTIPENSKIELLLKELGSYKDCEASAEELAKAMMNKDKIPY